MRDEVEFLSAVPNKPILQCTVEQDAITIGITRGDGIADKFSFVCGNCNDTSQHDDGITSLRYTSLAPYTWYTFVATAIVGSEGNNRKESAETKLTCQTNEGRKYRFSPSCCIPFSCFIPDSTGCIQVYDNLRSV